MDKWHYVENKKSVVIVDDQGSGVNVKFHRYFDGIRL